MEHPRLALLRSRVLSLPLDEHGRAVLLKSIDYFGEQIMARPRHARPTRSDSVEALQQAALSGMTERALHEKYCG